MPSQSSRSTTPSSLEIAYTDKPVSGWGGLVLPFRFFEKVRLSEWLSRALPDGRTSNNQIPILDMVLALFALVLTGGRRFAHVERLRNDSVIRGILGADRLPSAMTLTRYFGGFVQAQVEHLTQVLSTWSWAWIDPPAEGEILDLDSTVFQRYGRQQGSLVGYNPSKRGRPSHHPLMAFLAHSKLVAHAWLRSGNSGSARGAEAFLDETLALLPEDLPLRGLRADSGFFILKFLRAVEAKKLPYAIAVKLNPRVKREIAGISQWREFGEGLEVGELAYKTHSWKRSRRMVVIRESIEQRPDAAGRLLFDLPEYRFHQIVTSMSEPGEEVWRFYNGRADAENRIKELKHDLGADGFCLKSFDGTEAVFRLICFLYNVLQIFKREVLDNDRRHLTQIRHSTFVVGAILGSSGRRRMLRLGLKKRRRRQFEALVQRLGDLNVSTVMHQLNELINQSLGPPRRWRRRASRGRSGGDFLAMASSN